MVHMVRYKSLAGIPVEGKSSDSQCLICMKYRIIILIIIIISLGQILYCILQIHHACAHARAHKRTRAHARACTRAHTAVAAVTVRRTGYRNSMSPNRDSPLRLRQCRSLAIQITTRTGDPITPIFWMFFAYKTLLGRTETRTRDRMCFQTIRTVTDDRTGIATCRLRTPTDRHI